MKTISEMSLPYIVLDVNAYGTSELDIEINLVGTDNWKSLVKTLLLNYLPLAMIQNLLERALKENYDFAYDDINRLITINVIDKGSK